MACNCRPKASLGNNVGADTSASLVRAKVRGAVRGAPRCPKCGGPSIQLGSAMNCRACNHVWRA